MPFALHLIHSLVYGVMSLLASCDRTDTTSFIGIMMRLHTLLGMKAGDMAFALHMHYNFGLWHDGLGLRLWMSCKKPSSSKVWWLLIFTIYGVVSIVGRISLLIVGVHINYASPKFGGY